MRLVVATDDQEIAKALLQADNAVETADSKLGHLNADLSTIKTITFKLTSLKAIGSLAASVWKQVKPFVTSKPKAKLKFVGPFGEINAELENLSEASLQQMFQQIVRTYQKVTDGDGKSQGGSKKIKKVI